MHCLAGTFCKELPIEQCKYTGLNLFPIKIVLPPNKSRVLYFQKREEQNKWSSMLLQAMGFSNLFDHYDLGKKLG